jgi:hypothetical protein
MKTRLILLCFILVLIVIKMGRPSNASILIEKIPVAITFNADVWGAQEELINVLNVLDKHGIRSTFFFLGKYAELKPDVLRLVFRGMKSVRDLMTIAADLSI